MKYLKYVFALLAVIIVITLMQNPRKVTKSDFLLDTYVSVTAYGKGADKATDEVLKRTREIENLLSAYIPESDVSRINTAQQGLQTVVSRECFSLIERALYLSHKTNGAFDISIKPALDLWGFGKEETVPNDEELLEVTKKVNYENIKLNYGNSSVILFEEGMKIDLGGIAKGYCADEAVRILKENNIESAYIDFGGNVVTLGEKPLGLFERIRYGKRNRPFVIGVQDPTKARGETVDIIEAKEDVCSIVTSGGYERYFEQDGKTYHHILDPKTGRQPENDILSVTVKSVSSTDGDALSTAIFVLGDNCDFKSLKGLAEEIIIVRNTGEIEKIYP